MLHRIVLLLSIFLIAVGARGCSRKRRCPQPPVSPAREHFTFAVLGDRGGSDVDSQVFRRCLADIKKRRADFIMSIGDLVEGDKVGTAELGRLWDELDRLTNDLAAKLHVAPGNDDIPDAAALGVFEDRFGAVPYSFDYGESHFIILNTEQFNILGCRRRFLGRKQLAWLAGDLEQSRSSRHIFLFCHRPPWIQNEKLWKARLVPMLKGLPVVFFAGHYHQYFKRTTDGFACYVVPPAGSDVHTIAQAGHFHGYLFVTVEGADVRVAVIAREGVLPEDYVLEDEIPVAETAAGLTLDLSPMEPSDGGTRPLTVSARVSNPAWVTLDGKLNWNTAGTSFSVRPDRAAFVLDAGQAKSFDFDVVPAAGPAGEAMPRCVAEYGYVNAAGIAKRFRTERPLVPAKPIVVARVTGADPDALQAHSAGPFPIGGPGQVAHGADSRRGAADVLAHVRLACTGDRLHVGVAVTDDIAVPTRKRYRPTKKGDGVFVTAQAADTSGRALGAPVWVGVRARPDGSGGLYLPSEPPELDSRLPYERREAGPGFDVPRPAAPRGKAKAATVDFRLEPAGYTAMVEVTVPGLARAEKLFLDVIVCDADESQNVETRLSLTGRDSSWWNPSAGLLVAVEDAER